MKLSESIRKYFKRRLKLLIHFLIIFYNKYNLYRRIKKVRRSLPGVSNIDRENKKKYFARWARIGSRPSLSWYKVYKSVSGIDDPLYITEPDYYHKVELILNNVTLYYAYTDKNNYHMIFDHSLLPDVYVRNIEGVYYSGDYTLLKEPQSFPDLIPSEAEKIIIKPSIASGGGKSIQFFQKKDNRWINNDGTALDINYLSKSYPGNFVIQEYVHQHPFYSQFNKESVNTIRLITYRSVKNNDIIPVQAALRIGRKGSMVDNISSGGLSCGINSEGKLNSFGIDPTGNKYEGYNDICFREVGPVYGYDKIIQTAREVAGRLWYHRIAGFDLCIDHTGSIKIIEVNLHDLGINFIQMNNGPLFREYTDEIIDYCTRNPMIISFDLKI